MKYFLPLLALVALSACNRPCPGCAGYSGIDTYMGISLTFPSLNVGDVVSVAILNPRETSAIDDVEVVLDESLTVTIGNGSAIRLSAEDTYGDAMYDYVLALPDGGLHFLTNIQVLQPDPGERCPCPTYQLSSLVLDGTRHEVLSAYWTYTFP